MRTGLNHRCLLKRLIVSRREEAGIAAPEPRVEVRDWRGFNESVAEVEAKRAAIATFIDATFGVGTAARLGPDPYRAVLLGHDRDCVSGLLASRLKWKLRSQERGPLRDIANALGTSDAEAKVVLLRAGLLLAAADLEKKQAVKLGHRWFTDAFDGGQVTVEPWALAHYRDPVAVLRWFVSAARRSAVGILRDELPMESQTVQRSGQTVPMFVAYHERHVRPDPGWTNDGESTLEQEEREQIFRRLVQRIRELAGELKGLSRRLLEELAAAACDPDGVAWPNRMAKSRTIAVLRTDPEFRDLARKLGWDIAA